MFIDSHCHFDFPEFDSDREAVLARCRQAGVGLITVPGTTPPTWPRVLQLAAAYPELRAALGIHPYFLEEMDESDLVALQAQVEQRRSDIVAVGETGLDVVIEVDYDKQLHFFEFQLELAARLDLPVIIHSRKANDQVAKCLRKSTVKRGVIHGFAGSLEQAKVFWELGFYLGVGGVITYERARKTRSTIARMPLEALVLETDAPDMPLCGRQGKRNSPEYLPEIYAVLSRLRPEPPGQIQAQVLENTRNLFALR